MPNASLSTQLDRIAEKKALYKKRVEEARQKQRPDIEKIWLDEIKVLDEQRDALLAKQEDAASTVKSPPPGNAQIQRELRQLENQIDYIERKIGIHKQRGEWVAVRKQTALLEQLEAKRAQLKASLPSPQTGSTTQTSTAAPEATAKTTPPARALDSRQQKQLAELDRQIAHADKMIAEYRKFHSPKEQEWIGKRFQLVTQREKLLNSSEPAATSPSTPPPLPTHTTSSPATPAPLTADTIASAQMMNNQVRLLDLEIAHADKMIKEYQRYHSPKADQWLQRKQELLARRARVTGQPATAAQPVPSATQDAATHKRLSIIALELAHADKMIREYQKYHSPKADQWISTKSALLAEKSLLEGGSVSAGSAASPVDVSSTTPAIDRESIKAQIRRLNQQAQDADSQMRAALKQGNHQLANQLLQQRNALNEQAKNLTAQLSGQSVSHTSQPSMDQPQSTHTSPQSPQAPQATQPTPASTSASHSAGQASELEKNIAYKYLHTRNYTEEHAYIEIIDTLLQQPKYQHLIPAKETLYNITHPSRLPPRGMTINNPFIRDCFKIKISNIQLDGYTINDTIFNTSFPDDFDGMVDRINPHLAPAPPLKHYQYLAHRDAIQLIPQDPSISRYHSQFAGARIHDLSIKNITIRSKGSLQGLFASDGAFENIHMENISVQTHSAHQIAILGLLSGTMDLSSANGKPIHVNLLPLRLAGGNNIYINSFSPSSSYQYGTVSAGRSNAVIADNRRAMTKRGTYYKDFDMDEFFAIMRRAAPDTSVLENIKEAAKAAGTLARVV